MSRGYGGRPAGAGGTGGAVRVGVTARAVGAAALVLALVAGCGADDGPADGAASSGTGSAVSGHIVVLAAASLTEAFTELGERFEADHPGSDVEFSFGPSSGLASSIVAGSPADVFAAASPATMATVADAGLAPSAAVFATNTLEIAVPADNPAGIDGLDDLASPDVTVALCQEEVPCGTVAATTLGKAGIDLTPVSREADVKAVLTKVALGEVDAGIVYVTDVHAAGDDVLGVPIADDVNTATDYPISVIDRDDAAAAERATAEAFVAFVRSAEAADVLSAAGFTPAAP